MSLDSKQITNADPNLLSVIIPAYKCSTVERDLKAIDNYLQQINNSQYEIICVVDGRASARDRTLEKAKKAKSTTIKIYTYETNKGKGYAIRYGMARAKGGIIAFIDAGSDLNASGIGMAIEHMKWYNADIIIGSKRHKASKVNYPLLRRIPSFIVQKTTQILYRINVSDTQTGLKIFKREVLEQVLPRLVVKRFAFDLEILGVAHRLGYNRIYESPIELEFKFSSTVTFFWGLSFLIDYLAILYRMYFLRYYDDPNQDIWENDPKLKLKYKTVSDYRPFISIIIIDYKKRNPYLIECLDAIQKQTYDNYEILLLTDYSNNLKYPKLRKKSFSGYKSPTQKRDYGAKLARGEILAFIDDDAFPTPVWLEKLIPHYRNQMETAVGGPGVTPTNVNWKEAASGWVSASPLGAGPFTYRFLPDRQRAVDDYPSMNLSVRKKDFLEVGGFDSHYWPGEDTKLCLDLINKLGKRIIYDPQALVYHHRRPLWWPHLKQNGNFGLHRGYFARILPKTSLRLSYFAPPLSVINFFYIVTALNYPILKLTPLYKISLGLFWLYLILLVFNSLWIWYRSQNILQGIVSIPAILLTHFWYGIRFIQGFVFVKTLNR